MMTAPRLGYTDKGLLVHYFDAHPTALPKHSYCGRYLYAGELHGSTTVCRRCQQLHERFTRRGTEIGERQ